VHSEICWLDAASGVVVGLLEGADAAGSEALNRIVGASTARPVAEGRAHE
jgi:hypothetical protein